MQRRAAAAYFLFFLVLGASAYSVLALAEQPHVNIEGQTYSQGDSFAVDGQQYTVTELKAEESSGGGGGGHGGGGGESGPTYTGKLVWTNESAVSTATLENGSSVSYQGGNYTVAIPNQSQPSSFSLQPSNNTSGGPQQFSTGDQFQYEQENVTATVANITASEVTLQWTGPKNNTVELSEGANVTLNGQQYVVHFKSENQVQISQDIAGYQNALDRQAYFTERQNGLKGIVILSGSAAVLLLGLAYLPRRG